MAVGYVNNKCYWKVPPRKGANRKTGAPSDLFVLDSSAYVSAVAKISGASSFVMARLYESSKVIALDFRNNAGMSDALDRISQFVETNAKKSIPTQEEIKTLLKKHKSTCGSDDRACGLAAGHDLKMADVAEFFSRCKSKGFKLTAGEQELLDSLVKSKLLKRTLPGGYAPSSKTVLIGMSRSKAQSDRREIFRHEYSHALYFTNPVFRKKVSHAWSSLKPAQRRFLRGAMMASGFYASGEKWLMETEAQAHAIAPPIGKDGFLETLLRAELNCKKPSRACSDFFSFRGNIRGLLVYLNAKYTAVSSGWIPDPMERRHAEIDVRKLVKGLKPKPTKTLEDLVKELPDNFTELKKIPPDPLLSTQLELLRSSIRPGSTGIAVPRYSSTIALSLSWSPSPEDLLDKLQREFDWRHRAQ
jgi:hypothetical protein